MANNSLNLRWILAITIAMKSASSTIVPPCTSASKTVLEVCHIGEVYDKAEYPDIPLIVNVSFVINDVTKINENDQRVTLALEIAMYWIDQRLSINDPEKLQRK